MHAPPPVHAVADVAVLVTDNPTVVLAFDLLGDYRLRSFSVPAAHRSAATDVDAGSVDRFLDVLSDWGQEPALAGQAKTALTGPVSSSSDRLIESSSRLNRGTRASPLATAALLARTEVHLSRSSSCRLSVLAAPLPGSDQTLESGFGCGDDSRCDKTVGSVSPFEKHCAEDFVDDVGWQHAAEPLPQFL